MEVGAQLDDGALVAIAPAVAVARFVSSLIPIEADHGLVGLFWLALRPGVIVTGPISTPRPLPVFPLRGLDLVRKTQDFRNGCVVLAICSVARLLPFVRRIPPRPLRRKRPC